MSQFSATAFLHLGKAMKNYAIANLISIVSGFIITIIMQATVFTQFMNVTSDTDVMELVYIVIPIIVVFGFIGFGIGIFVLVRYFQYLSALKNAGESADDPNLRRAYRLELWGLILSLVLPVVLVLVSVEIFITLIQYLLGSYSPYYTYEEIYTNLFVPLITFLLLVILGSSIIIILQIVAKFAIDNWATGIADMYSGNPYAINLHEGTTFMKWGVVVQLCFGTIGSIVYIYGLFRAGNNAIALFSTPPSVTPARIQQQPYSGYGSGPSFQSYYQPNVSGTTTRPPTGAVGSSICPACGIMLPEPNTRFCPNCGRAL